MAIDAGVQERVRAACERGRVAFWEDAVGEFEEDIGSLSLPGVTVLQTDEGALAVKRRVLVDEPDGRFLIYRAGGAPAREDDFLLDIKLSAAPVSITQAAVWTEELGLPRAMEPVVEEHAEFFRAQVRRERLEGILKAADWIPALDDRPAAAIPRAEQEACAEALRLAMLAACCEVDAAHAAHATDARREIARRLLIDYATDISDKHSKLRLIERCGLEDALWRALGEGFGYRVREGERPSIEDFALEVMLSACADLTGEAPHLTSDANVLLSDMAAAKASRPAWRNLVERTAGAVLERCDLDALPLETLVGNTCLPGVDGRIIARLEPDVEAGLDCAGRIRRIAAQREALPVAEGWVPAYRALEAASGVLHGGRAAQREIDQAVTAHDCFERYAAAWSGVDAAYRVFRQSMLAAAEHDGATFNKLSGLVEDVYGTYTRVLAERWQGLVVKDGSWPPANVGPLQTDFFKDQVRDALVLEGRVAVIVSDALRYEAGAAWAERLGQQGAAGTKVQAVCSPLLSALPSYTQLGMAALLPHRALELNPGTHEVSSDGQSTKGTANRGKILSAAVPGALALTSAEAQGEEGRQALQTAPLAYIYHDVIDHTGDDLGTEGQVMGAVERAMDELDALVRRLLQCGFDVVLVTADHGFLYQEGADVPEVEVPGLGIITAGGDAHHSRRFVAAPDLPHTEGLVEFPAERLGLAGSYEVGFPTGTGRLKLKASGKRFVHGGMTLQETVVPLVRVKRAQAGAAAQPVGAQIRVLGSTVIAGGSVRFIVYQTEPAGPGASPATVRAALWDADGRCVSEVRELRLASESAQDAERQTEVGLAVGSDVPDGARLTLRLERRQGRTNRYSIIDERAYTVRRAFGMDF